MVFWGGGLPKKSAKKDPIHYQHCAKAQSNTPNGHIVIRLYLHFFYFAD